MLMRCMEELNGRCDMKENIGEECDVLQNHEWKRRCEGEQNGRGRVKENRMEEVV